MTPVLHEYGRNTTISIKLPLPVACEGPKVRHVVLELASLTHCIEHGTDGGERVAIAAPFGYNRGGLLTVAEALQTRVKSECTTTRHKTWLYLYNFRTALYCTAGL